MVGDPVKITEKAIYNNAKEMGHVDAAGNIIKEVKIEPDLVDKALASRFKEGKSYTHVVSSKIKVEELVFKLKLMGKIPELA